MNSPSSTLLLLRLPLLLLLLLVFLTLFDSHFYYSQFVFILCSNQRRNEERKKQQKKRHNSMRLWRVWGVGCGEWYGAWLLVYQKVKMLKHDYTLRQPASERAGTTSFWSGKRLQDMQKLKKYEAKWNRIKSALRQQMNECGMLCKACLIKHLLSTNQQIKKKNLKTFKNIFYHAQTTIMRSLSLSDYSIWTSALWHTYLYLIYPFSPCVCVCASSCKAERQLRQAGKQVALGKRGRRWRRRRVATRRHSVRKWITRAPRSICVPYVPVSYPTYLTKSKTRQHFIS